MGLLKAVAVTALLSVFAVIRLVSGPQPQSARRSVVEAVSPPRRQLFTRVFSADAADLNNTCGYEVQQAYGCSKPGCEDLAAGACAGPPLDGLRWCLSAPGWGDREADSTDCCGWLAPCEHTLPPARSARRVPAV